MMLKSRLSRESRSSRSAAGRHVKPAGIRSSAVLLMSILSVSIIASCSEKNPSELQMPVSQYDFAIVYSRDVDSNLAQEFNERKMDDLIPNVQRFQSSKEFPDALPGVKLLSARFESTPSEGVYIFYDKTADRFYGFLERYLATALPDLTEGRLGSDITARQAFEIAALAVYLKYNPRIIVCRRQDIFLESRIRDYVNQTYAQKPGESPRELSSDWWAWSAFPTANDDYRKMLAKYNDQIDKSSLLEDVPDGVIELPTVTKEGLYYEISMCGLPRGTAREIHKYRLRVAPDGRLHDMDEETVLTY